MTAEKFLLAWFRSTFLIPKVLTFGNTNVYYRLLQSLCEQIIAGHKFAKGQQSIIDRCTENVYRFYQQSNYQGTPPTLQDFREELLK